MSAENIYSITPTVLMVKKHNKTGLLYFCKTVRLEQAKSYSGSGVYWKRHLKEHGNDFSTLWISDVFYDSAIVKVAVSFSDTHDIVNSKLWANLIPENGLDGYNKPPKPSVIYTKNCACCNEVFKTKNNVARFCSKSCSSKTTGGRKVKEKIPNCVCDECQTPIFKFPSHIKKSSKNFCGKCCTASYYNKLYNKRPLNKYEKVLEQ